MDEIRVDILSLQACPVHRLEGKGLLRLQLDDETIIWYSEAAGTGNKIKFANVKGVPTIELEHRYRLPSGSEDAIESQGIQRKANALSRTLAKKDWAYNPNRLPPVPCRNAVTSVSPGFVLSPTKDVPWVHA